MDVAGAIKLIGGGYEMDVGGGYEMDWGGYEIDRGAYEIDGGAMKLMGGGYEIDWGGSNRLWTYGDLPKHTTRLHSIAWYTGKL